MKRRLLFAVAAPIFLLLSSSAFAACSYNATILEEHVRHDGSTLYRCDSTNNWVAITGLPAAASGSSGYVQFNTSGALDAESALYWDKTNNRLGIGTSTPTTLLHVYGTPVTFGANRAVAGFIDSTAFAADVGGGIYFGGLYAASSTAEWAGIKSGKANGTSGDYGAYMAFMTRTNGSSTAERMRIDSSGNVGIGTASPANLLHLQNSSSNTYTASGSGSTGQLGFSSADPVMIVDNLSATDGSGAYLQLIARESGSRSNSAYIGAVSTSGLYAPSMIFGVRAGNASWAERMRIDSNGKVGIGTTTPGASLDVYGGTSEVITNIRNSAGVLSFASGITNPTYGNYIAGLTASGAAYAGIGLKAAAGPPSLWVHTNGGVGIGTTAPAEQLTVSTTANMDKLGIYNFGTGKGNGVVFQPYADDAKVFSFRNAAATEVGSIVIKSTSTLYNVASDRRLKENIASTTRGLADLLRLGVKDFNFISDPKKERVQGFIAQDFYKVYPEAVQVGGDDPKEHPWQVDYGRLTPLLVKAIQELKADNDNLRRDLAATEHRLQALEQAQPDSRPREKRSQ